MTDVPGFFTTLGALASPQQENQLSRSLKACFNHSTEFRRVLLRLVREKLHLAPAPPERYSCHVEVDVGRRVGRLDLHFSVRDKSKASFCIESKVEATIGEEQLRKYYRHGVSNLLLVTKYPPQVSDRTLRRFGVQAFRWHDVHQALRLHVPTHGRDRFLFNSFATYLEESGMAYPTEIKSRDLSYMAETFRAIRADSSDRVPRSGFDTANRCLALLGLIAKGLRDQYPAIERAKTWGPGYFSIEDDSKKHWHALSVNLYRQPWSPHRQLILAIYIPQLRGRLMWSIEFASRYRALPVSRFMKKGVLQTDAMLDYVLR